MMQTKHRNVLRAELTCSSDITTYHNNTHSTTNQNICAVLVCCQEESEATRALGGCMGFLETNKEKKKLTIDVLVRHGRPQTQAVGVQGVVAARGRTVSNVASDA